MSLGVTLLLHSFNKTVVFGLILDSWEVFSHILSQPSIVEYRFHLVDWALSQVRYRLVTPNTLCAMLLKLVHSQALEHGLLEVLMSLSCFLIGF